MPTLSGPSRAPLSGGPPDSLVVLLHGRGSNGDDLIGLADVIADQFPNTAFHSPNAPIDVGGFGYMWYPMDPPGGREQALHEIEPVMNEFVDELLADYGLPPSRCVMVGFSQGTILSIHIAPRRKEPIAGVVGFSGAMFSGDSLSQEIVSKPPFVLIHGSEDTMLAPTETETAGKKLKELGVPVSVHILPGLSHSIDQRGLNIAVQFMKEVLASPGERNG